MKECCSNCKYCLKLKKSDYSKGGCEHSDMDGFTCLAFASEEVAQWMIGINPDVGHCEAFVWKNKKNSEAHIMSIEEIEDALDTIIWIDKPNIENSSDTYALLEGYSRKNKFFGFRFVGMDASDDYIEYPYDTYGKVWRCWNKRP